MTTTETRPAARAVRRPPRRKPVKKATIWLHRWLSLVLGLVLVAECASGSLLVYLPEIERHLRADAYVDHGAFQGQNLEQSAEAVAAENPDLVLGGVNDDHGTQMVLDYEAGTTTTVDGRTGEVLDTYATQGHPSGWIGWTVAFSYNLHLCALTCEGYPGYQAWLTKDVPWVGETLGFSEDGETFAVTWGGLVLGVLAVLLIFLSLTGIWLWWPTLRHFRRGVRVRLGKNRYARDYDLHQVVGMVALPLLLMWGLTGISYEFGFVEKAWYKALPGEATQAPALTVDDTATTDIEYDAALAAAQGAAGTASYPISYYPPAADDPSGYWDFWFSVGYDAWRGTTYAGDREVHVDRHDATNTSVVYGAQGQGIAQTIYQDFNYPVHSGYFVNPWVRILWCVLGLVPLLLMWTGISTWLFKRAVRKRRRRGAPATAT